MYVKLGHKTNIRIVTLRKDEDASNKLVFETDSLLEHLATAMCTDNGIECSSIGCEKCPFSTPARGWDVTNPNWKEDFLKFLMDNKEIW